MYSDSMNSFFRTPLYRSESLLRRAAQQQHQATANGRFGPRFLAHRVFVDLAICPNIFDEVLGHSVYSFFDAS